MIEEINVSIQPHGRKPQEVVVNGGHVMEQQSMYNRYGMNGGVMERNNVQGHVHASSTPE